MRDFLIRKPQLIDIDAMMHIEEASFPEPWTRGMLLHEIASILSRGWLSAYDNGMDEPSVAGYILFWIVAGEIHLTRIAVKDAWRGRGIGSGLMQAMFHSAKQEEARRVTLEVRSSNIAARKLYEKSGFTLAGVRPRYYENREDAMIMCMEIQGNENG
jgi:ribosomal-protein-alanine N-acetyltransferase